MLCSKLIGIAYDCFSWRSCECKVNSSLELIVQRASIVNDARVYVSSYGYSPDEYLIIDSDVGLDDFLAISLIVQVSISVVIIKP
jgi:hypothetical protein